jgi:hypothetical protein
LPVFNNQNVTIPGVRSRIDASGLTPVVTGSVATVVIVGAATGGQPGIVQWFTDPAKAESTLRSGPALDAAQFAWDPSSDSSVPGASVIGVVRVNPATQSTSDLTTAAAAPAITLTSKDWGAWTTGIRRKIEAGTTSGVKVTINYNDQIIEVYDNLATNDDIVAAINAGSSLVSATKLSNTIVANAAYANLTGGTEGAATTTEWTAALSAIQQEWVDIIVPVTEDGSILAAYVAHAKDCAERLGKERMIFCGVSPSSGSNWDNVITSAVGIRSSRAALFTPGLQRVATSGVTSYSASYMAACAAGMAAGMGVKEPLTSKSVKAVGLTAYFDEDAQAALLKAGVSVVARDVLNGSGFSIVQGVTTHVADANPVYKEISVRRTADAINVRLRKRLKKFVGKPGDASAQTSMLNGAISELGQIERDGWITADPADPVANPAFKNVRLFKQGDAYYVEYEASVVQPINYILITAHL